MFRLTVLLCCGVFGVLLIAGEDKGQKRQGLTQPPLMARSEAPQTVAIKSVERVPALTEAVFVPAQPVRVALPRATDTTNAGLVQIEEVTPEPQPERQIAVVNARSVNVRSGPSTSDTIVGRLTNGEQVSLVSQDSGVAGWSLITIEGDGIRGYVATRLLRPLAP